MHADFLAMPLRSMSRWKALLGAALVYTVAAWAGTGMSAGAEGINIFWPAAGLGATLASSVSKALRRWVVVGIGLGTIASGLPVGKVPLLQLLGAAFANGLEGYVAGVILSTALPQAHRIVRRSDIGVLLKAAVLAAGTGAIVGGSASAIAFESSWAASTVSWFLADALGIVLIAPGALAVVSALKGEVRVKEWLKTGAFGGLTLAVLGSAIWLRGATGRSFAYLVLLPLMLSTIFAGQRASSILTVVISSSVVWTTQLGIGPFAVADSPISSVLTAQIFLAVIQLTLLLMATESSRRRDALAEMEGVFDAAMDAVLVLDERGTVRRANLAGQEMFGWGLVGANFSDFLVSPLDHEAVVKQRSVLTRCRRLNGEEFWGEVSVGEASEDSRRIRKAIVIRDATSRVEADKRMEQLRDQFVANMSHELRSPLTSIVGYSELLLDDATEETKSQLTVVNASARQLARIVDDILDFKRSAEAPLAKAIVDIAALTNRILSDLAPLAASREVTIHLTGDEWLIVEGDEEHLGRVVTNLVSNAVKYSPSGGNVRVFLQADNGFVRFGVADEGIGIPDDDQPRIFERFFRASNAVAAKIPGTGLGLAYARQIARAHGGDLTLVSTLGTGTTITLTLPLLASDLTDYQARIITSTESVTAHS